jgi:hypothetical protein
LNTLFCHNYITDRFGLTSAERHIEHILDEGNRKLRNFEVIATDSLILGGGAVVFAERMVCSFTHSRSGNEITVVYIVLD